MTKLSVSRSGYLAYFYIFIALYTVFLPTWRRASLILDR
jgi:hypothetical protein